MTLPSKILHTTCTYAGIFLYLVPTASIAGRYEDPTYHSRGWFEEWNLVIVGAILFFAYKAIRNTLENGEDLSQLYRGWLSLLFFPVIICVIVAWFPLPSFYYVHILRTLLFITIINIIFSGITNSIFSTKHYYFLAFLAYLHNPIAPVAFRT